MLRKLLTGAFAGLAMALSLVAASAAQIPLLQGPWDPGNALGSLNSIVQSFNFGTTGNLSTVTTPVSTSLTTIQTLATLTLPGGQLSAVGQALHVRAFGVNNSSTNAVTFTFSFGGSTLTQTLTGATNNWYVDCTVIITAIGASPGQTAECHGQTGTTVTASTQATNWTVATGSAVTVLLEGTVATSGTTTLNGAVFEQLK